MISLQQRCYFIVYLELIELYRTIGKSDASLSIDENCYNNYRKTATKYWNLIQVYHTIIRYKSNS